MGANSYFDLGGGLAAFQKGYQAKRELEQRDLQLAQAQQQADYAYPRNLVMSPGMLGSLATGPMRQMQEAQILATALQGPPQERPIYENKGGNIRRVTPGASYEAQPRDMIQAEDPQRSPAGGNPPRPGSVGLPAGLYDGTIAAMFGLQQDPKTGAVSGVGPSAGRQVKEYYDMVEKIVGAQAGIFAANSRPQVSNPLVVNTNPPRASGGGRAAAPKKTPFEESLIAEKNQLLKSISGIGGAILGKKEKEQIRQRMDKIDETLSGGSSRFMQQPALAAPANSNASSGSISLQDATAQAAQGQGRILQRKNGTKVFRDAQGNQVDVK